ncbi:hypothetical protein [Sporolactobacillus shoreicorticis]|uniref:Uncharacterized protein n=1 Tax=Sporolactobacillus shoreicorticis TaxID=1923877 RepID=A0ABW5S4B3_9BACL|nr:hypothetical protein [Sporolactobacillus shoreicorticis]
MAIRVTKKAGIQTEFTDTVTITKIDTAEISEVYGIIALFILV